MSAKDIIKKTVLESFGAEALSQYDVPRLLMAMLIALVMGCLIFIIYRRFYTGVVYSHSFGVTLVGMTVLTCMVTLAISTNIVISLGMVGALSIVRFRTAIKDPLDLLYLFWAITTGITVGAGLYVLSLCAAGIMLLLVLLFQRRRNEKRVYTSSSFTTTRTRQATASCARSAGCGIISNPRRCARRRRRWPWRSSAGRTTWASWSGSAQSAACRM